MKNLTPTLLILILILLIIVPVSGAVYATDNSFSVNIKYDNGVASVDEMFVRNISGRTLPGSSEPEEILVGIESSDIEKDLINVITITKDGTTTLHNVQTPQISNIYVSSRTIVDLDVMQTTTEPGYSVLEIHWGYDKSESEPWRYYMRVNNIDDTYAVFSDFRTKAVWIKPIKPTRTAEIISSGTIPKWGEI